MKKLVDINNLRIHADDWANRNSWLTDTRYEAVLSYLRDVEDEYDRDRKLGSDLREIEFLITKLEKKEKFATFSFAEGEWNAIINGHTNSPREAMTPTLREELLDCLKICSKPENYLLTIDSDPVMSEAEKLIVASGAYRSKWLSDAQIFNYLLIRCSHEEPKAIELLHRLLKALQKRSIILVGGAHLEEVVKKWLPEALHVITPVYGATCWPEFITEMTQELIKSEEDVVCLSCGIAANLVTKRLAGRATFLDLGAFWDMTLGIGTRYQSVFNTPMFKKELL